MEFHLRIIQCILDIQAKLTLIFKFTKTNYITVNKYINPYRFRVTQINSHTCASD